MNTQFYKIKITSSLVVASVGPVLRPLTGYIENNQPAHHRWTCIFIVYIIDTAKRRHIKRGFYLITKKRAYIFTDKRYWHKEPNVRYVKKA